MSFLARLSLRSRPTLSRVSAVMPKGLAVRQPAPVYRAAETPDDEEEQAQPLRRAATRPIRRVEGAAPAEDEIPRATAPAPEQHEDEEPPATARRAPMSLNRAHEQNEEPQEEGEPDEPTPASRLIRRAEEVPLEDGDRPLRQPFQEDLSPGASPLPPDMATEEEPPAMQALRRAIPRPAGPSPRGEVGVPPPPGGVFDEGAPDRSHPFAPAFGGEAASLAHALMPFDTGFAPAGGSGPDRSERPQVIIDQVDVVIHEPAPPAVAARAPFDAARAMRARYLRRL
ncbi:hypothetical protein LGR54_05470 [Ancylobacter sp. Lp-2]|uniref:hypothetical protein n=1 Tax=Ancylobacter sp. Lp-2 TaxID=2881339 RepID=UPI001E2DD9D0|nr:hypothetical protein [Ancylobacter sp. Lp-2]MCB4768045.1 hypothetical protein [Ancylobacter sp. Lp-2]